MLNWASFFPGRWAEIFTETWQALSYFGAFQNGRRPPSWIVRVLAVIALTQVGVRQSSVERRLEGNFALDVSPRRQDPLPAPGHCPSSHHRPPGGGAAARGTAHLGAAAASPVLVQRPVGDVVGELGVLRHGTGVGGPAQSRVSTAAVIQ